MTTDAERAIVLSDIEKAAALRAQIRELNRSLKQAAADGLNVTLEVGKWQFLDKTPGVTSVTAYISRPFYDPER